MSNARPTPSHPDDDPHRWLEDRGAPGAVAWAEERTAETLATFADSRFNADRDALKAMFDRPDRLPFIARRGERIFNFWQDASNPRGLWRATTTESFAGPASAWDVLLDLDGLAREEGEDWVWNGVITRPGAHDRAIVLLSRGGGDAVVLREFDLATRRFVDDGFSLPEAKGAPPSWVDRDTLLLVSAHGEAMANRSGYPRTVRLWRRGTDPATAPVIFTVSDDRLWVSAGVRHDGPVPRLWFCEGDHTRARVWYGDRDGPKQRLDLPEDALSSANRLSDDGWIAIRLRSPWTVDGTTHPTDSVLGLSLRAFLAGDRAFTVLFEPAERRMVHQFFWSGERLVLCVLDDLRPVVTAFTPSGTGWSREALAGLPEQGMVWIGPLDAAEEEANGDLIAITQGPLSPSALILYRAGEAPRLLKRAEADFDTGGLEITRHDALSEDGTRVPYWQVGPAGAGGDAPVLMRGYGGFGVSSLPCYDGPAGKLWLERGGILVIANIRGGGEFGVAWHHAGRREGKRVSHDDFAAVAVDLVRRGVTRPDRIAAEGGSNGGLLVANMLTRYPERFGAIFCAVPLIDMRRYTAMGGAIWSDEYGDPDDPDDWRFLAGLSAYHMARPGQPYPPILIATNRRDDRVHCGHGRKMAAKLRAMGYGNAYFLELDSGGHSCGTDSAQQAAFIALALRFLRHAIGWDPISAG